MARTKAEVRAFLDSLVGKIAPHPGYPSLNGQCVTLTKALMEFLGVPNPYAARGNAIDAGDTYIAQGLGTPGKGWLTIVVNRDMGYIDGVHYGHIWIDLQGEANYEANGARALYTTKNTRPISQGQQFVNFDKWVSDGGDDMKVTAENLRYLYMGIYGQDPNVPVDPNDPEIGKDYAITTERLLDYANKNAFAYWQYKPKADKTIADLTSENIALTKRVADLEAGGEYIETKVYVKKG